MLLMRNKRYKKRSSTRTTEDFIKLAREVHGEKYNYDKSVYDTCNDPITITCKTHGDFTTTARIHLDGSECHQCQTDRRSTLDTNTFIERSRSVHGDRYNYDKTIYTRMRGKVIITCRAHGDFEQYACNHIAGRGCRKCFTKNVSKKSNIANEWLDYMGIASDSREVTIDDFPRRPFDAFVAETNTVYQFHGDYWHGNIAKYSAETINASNGKTMGELYEATLEWDQQIRDLGYNLVVMWESDWRKMRKQLLDVNQTV